MNRRYFFLGMASMAVLAGCGRSSKPRLNVYNWSTYVAPDTISNFETEFDVTVRYATYESNEEMLAKVITGNSGWDIVFPTYTRIKPMQDYGLLQPLHHQWLTGLDNLDPLFHTPVWDRDLQWNIPYMWFGTGIAYNRTLNPQPTRWADLWDARLKGRLTMLDDPEDMLGACLKKLGLSFNATDQRELERAKQEAIAQKPLVQAYLNAEVRDQLVSGDVLAAQLWATTAQQAVDAAANLAFAYPQEGFPLYCDCAVILRESERAELAHRFLSYLLRPKVAAASADYTRVATVNGAAKSFLPEATRNSPTLYPPPSVLERGEWPQALPPAAQRLRDKIWTEIKSS